MKRAWAWRVARLAGVDVYVHATFVLLLAWVAGAHLVAGHGALVALAGVALVLAVFAVVVLHELGHALVARRYGIGTRDITLLPIGGVAQLERMPEEPTQELAIAIAGPRVNVALAAVLFAASALVGEPLGPASLVALGGPMAAKLAWVNVGLAVFNILPAFPMDGGRVLRALLAMRMPHARATDVAAAVGQGMAVAFGIVGFFFSPMLVIVALFVWMGAQTEASTEHARASLRGITAGQVMATDVRALGVGETVGEAAAHVLAGFQRDFPVLDARGGTPRVVGLLGRTELLRALAQGRSAAPVAEVMRANVDPFDDRASLDAALERFSATNADALPIVHDGALVGLLTRDRLGELLFTRAAVAAR
jgi:Zn-dependent protease